MKKIFLAICLVLVLGIGSAWADITTVQPSSGIAITDAGVVSVKAVMIGTFASPITSEGTYSLAAANCYNSILFYDDTDTIALPAAVAGMNIIIYCKGTNAITIDPNTTDVIVRDGTAQDGGVTMTLTGAAGNYVALLADAANHWVTLGFKGTLAVGS